MSFYSGDLTPKLLASGTEIVAGATFSTGLFTEANSAMTARLEKPMFYVVVTTTGVATGTGMVITYQEKINEVYIGADKTTTIPLVAVSTTNYTGVVSFTNEYSAIKVKSVKNYTNKNTVTFKVYLTGKILY